MTLDTEVFNPFDMDLDLANIEYSVETKRPRLTREERTAQCGKKFVRWNPKLGKFTVRLQPCKNPDECEYCASVEKDKAHKAFLSFVGLQYLEVSQDEEKTIARQFDILEYKRRPLENGRTLFIIETDKEVGQPLTAELALQFSQRIELKPGRRASGKLGFVVVPPSDLPTVDCREMDIEFNSLVTDAPQTFEELEVIVQEEVEIYDTPQNLDQIQWYVYLLEEKTREVCFRYNMSFNFLVKKKYTVELNHVKWRWAEKKQKPPSV